MGLHDYEHVSPLGFGRNGEFSAWRGREAKEAEEAREVEEKTARFGGHWSITKGGFGGCGEKGIFDANRFCEELCFL
jgi:hypothetical protein